MHWILVLMLFDTSNGGLVTKMHSEKLYQSEQACMDSGLALTQNVQYDEATTKGSFVCFSDEEFNSDQPDPPKDKKGHGRHPWF